MADLKPQPGPQEQYLASNADIAIYGGAAGGGKSFALLLEPLRHVQNKKFRAVIFRRTAKQIRNEGGLWDASRAVYGGTGAAATDTNLLWRFSSGASISFGSIEHEKNRFDWQGTEIAYLGFDELTHFTARQFFYLLSRNRSVSGVKPYVRATCNPDADSWVAQLIAWWIDQKTGYAIAERSGVVRWFIRDGDEFVWAGSRQALIDQYPEQEPKSATFVAASIEDNKILMQEDAGYKANLAALDTVERERLLKGNWIIRPAAGFYFRRSWFSKTQNVDVNCRSARGWDLAATADNSENRGDWTVGAKVSRDQEGRYVIEHVERFRGSPNDVEKTIERLAQLDGTSVTVALPQDPGQAGKAQIQMMARRLSGFRLHIKPVTGSKIARAAPFSSQVEAGNVFLLEGAWNEVFLRELEAFPTGSYDDQVDAVVEAFNAIQTRTHKSQLEMYS